MNFKQLRELIPKKDFKETTLCKKIDVKTKELCEKHEELTDKNGVKWPIINFLGRGGWGQIFSSKNNTCIKIGNVRNEKKIYESLLDSVNLDLWKLEYKLDFLGLPFLISHGVTSSNLFFLVIPKYDFNLHYILDKLSYKDKCKIFYSCINSLHYIHDNNFCHNDMKPDNVMFLKNDIVNKCFDRCYIIDFGTCCVAKDDGLLKKRCGTKTFTSIDAHNGKLGGYKGDLETMIYNFLYWNNSLPWGKDDDFLSEKLFFKRTYVKNLDVPFAKFVKFVYKCENYNLPNYGQIKKLVNDMIK